jgi:hypothetical protein
MTVPLPDPVSLLAEDVAALTDSQLAERLGALDGWRDAIEHAWRRTVGELDTRGAYTGDGAANTAVWLATRTGVSKRTPPPMWPRPGGCASSRRWPTRRRPVSWPRPR